MRKVWTKEELIAFEDRIGALYLDNQLPFLFHLSGRTRSPHAANKNDDPLAIN